jgi:hypothetical protein
MKHFDFYCQPDMIPYYETMGFGDISGDLLLMRLG